MLQYFEENNYAVYKISEEPVIINEIITADNLTQWQHYDILCFPQKNLNIALNLKSRDH